MAGIPRRKAILSIRCRHVLTLLLIHRDITEQVDGGASTSQQSLTNRYQLGRQEPSVAFRVFPP